MSLDLTLSIFIDQKYYNQKQGLVVGALISPCFTEIYIQRVEENHVYTMLNTSRLWQKKVDNTFAITSHDLGKTLQDLLWKRHPKEIYHFSSAS